MAEGDTEAILTTLIKGGLQASGRLALDWIDIDGPLSAALASVFAAESRLVVVDEFERPALYRPDYLQQTLSSRRIENYQRKLRLLEQEVGELTLCDAGHDPAAYARFIKLERSGWQGEVGSALACRPGHAVFFTQMCRGFAQSGRLLMLSLASERNRSRGVGA